MVPLFTASGDPLIKSPANNEHTIDEPGLG